MADREVASVSAVGQNLSSSQRTAAAAAAKKDKKEKKEKKKKEKKLKKHGKEVAHVAVDPPPPPTPTTTRKVIIKEPAVASESPDSALPNSPSADRPSSAPASTPLAASMKEPDPALRDLPTSHSTTDTRAGRVSLPGTTPSLSFLENEKDAKPSPPQSPASANRHVSISTSRSNSTGSSQPPASVADMIEKEAQASLSRSMMRSPPPSRGATLPGPSTVGSPKNRRTPSLTRMDQIVPNTGSLRRQSSDPELDQLGQKAAEADQQKKKESKGSSSVKRFSRISVVLGGLSPGVESSDGGRLETPDFVGSLVIELMDAHGLRPSADYDDFSAEVNPFCVFRVGEQDARSLVATRHGCKWNEHLTILCEEGSELLVLDVYDYISISRETIIGSASVELKHLFLGGFSDEWNEFSLRVDKENNAIVNFRCCFKPFVGHSKEKKPRDILGFELPEKVVKTYREVTAVKLKQDAERHRQLNRLFNWYRPKDVKDLKKFTRRGIPIAHRPEVWLVASGARKKLLANEGLYHKLLHENVSRTSAHTIQIDKDLHRTAGHHHLYRTVEGRSALRRILVAYSWKNAGLGYCQSMNFVGALLLLFLDEEAVFWLLATIVEDLLPDYFTREMLGSKADVQVFKEIAREKLPRLMSHFQKIDYELSLVLQPWFLCLFTGYLPTGTLLRVIDAFVLEGSKILFRVSLALLKMHEDALLAAKNNEEAHNLLKEIPQTCFDSDRLMKIAFKDLGSLFNSNIAGKIKVSREKYMKQYQESLKQADFRWLAPKTKFDHENLEALHHQFRAVSQKKADGNEDNSYLTLEAFEALMFGSLEDRPPMAVYLFRAFDTNRDQVVDFREFTIGLHLMTKGTPDEKIRFFFDSFDDDGDGYLTADQLSQLMNLQFLVLKQNDLTPSQKHLIVKNLLAKSSTGKLSFSEFRAAISEVSLLEAALQLAATAAESGGTGRIVRSTSPSTPLAKQSSESVALPLSASASAVERISHDGPTHGPELAKVPSSPVEPRVRKNSRGAQTGMRRSRSQYDILQLDTTKKPTKNEAGETVVANPLWRRPGGSVLPLSLKRDMISMTERPRIDSGRSADGRGSSSGPTLKASDDGGRSPRTSPRGRTSPRSGSGGETERKLAARGGPLTKSKSEAKDSKGRVTKHGDFHFEPLASLGHLTIDLSHLSRDARLRASRDLFATKSVGAQPVVSVTVSTSTASSGLRTSDKALAQSAAEALRTSKGLRNSDSALHQSVRNLGALTNKQTEQLRTSRSSEDLRKAIMETGVAAVSSTGPSASASNPSAVTTAEGTPKDGTPTLETLVISASVEMPPTRAQQRDSPARVRELSFTPPGRSSRSGSDLMRVTSSTPSPENSSGQNSPHSPPAAVLHQRRASAGSTTAVRAIKKENDEQHQALSRDSSGELKNSRKKASAK